MINYTVTPKSDNIGEGSRFFANPVSSKTIGIKQVAEHITSHGSVYSTADLQAVITLLTSSIRELLLLGYRVNLDDLCTFYLRLKSNGVESRDAFTDDDITDVSVGIRAGRAFKGMLADAEFKKDSTRAQKKVIFDALKQGLSLDALTAAGTADL